MRNCDTLYNAMAYQSKWSLVINMVVQLWLPPRRACRLSFLTEIMQGKKRVFNNSEIKIYRTDDKKITLELVLEQIKTSTEVLAYLPSKHAEATGIREYVFAIVNTIDKSFFERLIQQKLKALEQ